MPKRANRCCVWRMESSVVGPSPNSTRAQRSPICLRKSRSSSEMRALTRWASLMLAGSSSSMAGAGRRDGHAPPAAAPGDLFVA